MHVTKRAAGFAIAAASLLAISLPFAMTANAQTTTTDQLSRTDPAQGGAVAGPGQFNQGQRGQNPGNQPNAFGQRAPDQFRPGGGGGMGGGGGTAMDSDNNFLYVVQGNMVFKLNKGDLRIVAQTPLMQMQPGGPTFGSTPLPQPDRRNVPPSGAAGGGGGK